MARDHALKNLVGCVAWSLERTEALEILAFPGNGGRADEMSQESLPRPHRPARSAADAAAELRKDVAAGRLDAGAVEAVLAGAGHRVGRRRDRPAGLTARELDVLRLLARGLSAKEIATRLVITPKTARNHIEHIYAKIGTSNRVRASMFAVQHGLIPEDAAFAER